MCLPLSPSELARGMLEGRTAGAIAVRRSKLKRKRGESDGRRTWQAWEDQIATSDRSPEEIEAANLIPGRTAAAIRHRRHVLGHCPKKPPWKAAEDDYLRQHVHLAAPVLATELGRTVGAVQARRMALGLAESRPNGLRRFQPWEDDRIVRSVRDGETAAQIGQRLGRLPQVIRRRISKLREQNKLKQKGVTECQDKNEKPRSE